MQPVFTIGHSNLSGEDFTALLLEQRIDTVLDVRKLRGSAKFPQFNADQLEQRLAADSIALRCDPDLAGRRPVSKTVPFERNAWWQNRSFHNYADYAMGQQFADALQRVLELSREHRVALMCAEALWWRCHRRIIADHLLARGQRVIHVVGSSAADAALSAGAVPGPPLSYPAAVPSHSSASSA
ncbi:hypothetical protein AUR04nite_06590 [Glutamicibacter uratoxydans]|uniref:DNA repair protein n=1 Tax=Glutamicibacter uratoxydans TaxID=43667 RepID=A0A4Y4DKH5_GLUUR|nr:DUF488 domain-containing protein [Glutamicibacter uratoxydans]GED05127.1 hypothetical protein AUR04nite_06590 [Glutamicibacter uratoxydans]